jgi:hypothetical protein
MNSTGLAVASLIIPGLGQLIEGEYLKGIGWLVLDVAGAVFLVFTAIGLFLLPIFFPVVHIASAYQAYKMGE